MNLGGGDHQRKESQVARKKLKGEIITFKVDRSLFEAIENLPNRSEFIRTAILAALDSVCPLCNGAGVLAPGQKIHWKEFGASHAVEECENCHELRLVCLEGKAQKG